ncbi:MAG: hypothetical protein NTW21_41710 [Verrucomicrobia bacterium]|nr:hypothetical protein [Verrucomicrobiota bacterium]
MTASKTKSTGLASWPQDERPRERLLSKGAQALTDAELVAILIRVGFKEREEDIIANMLAVPLQKVRTFGKNGDGWHNKLIFGDNLQVMKSLLEMKHAENVTGNP